MKYLLSVVAMVMALTASAFSAEKYSFDPSHSQIFFSYNHLGFSKSQGMFSGFTGEAILDEKDPSKSSVTASIKIGDIITGWDKRTAHFLSGDFFKDAAEVATFKSTEVKMKGDKEATITGDLTLNGVTKSVTLEAKLNKIGQHPLAKKKAAGFDLTGTLKRTDFNLGKFAPNVSDEVDLIISVEMFAAE